MLPLGLGDGSLGSFAANRTSERLHRKPKADPFRRRLSPATVSDNRTRCHPATAQDHETNGDRGCSCTCATMHLSGGSIDHADPACLQKMSESRLGWTLMVPWVHLTYVPGMHT